MSLRGLGYGLHLTLKGQVCSVRGSITTGEFVPEIATLEKMLSESNFLRINRIWMNGRRLDSPTMGILICNLVQLKKGNQETICHRNSVRITKSCDVVSIEIWLPGRKDTI